MGDPLFFTVVPVEIEGLKLVDVFIWVDWDTEPIRLHWFCDASIDLAVERIARLDRVKDTDY